MVGALTAGAVGDYLGRRRMMLVNIAWFSIGMGLAALATNVTMFGLLRFFTGIGVGGLVATAGAMVAEFAPPGKRNLYNAIVYSGVPAGGVLASLLAIVLRDTIGWRGLFWIGALPIVILLPLALVKLPESPKCSSPAATRKRPAASPNARASRCPAPTRSPRNGPRSRRSASPHSRHAVMPGALRFSE